MSLIIKDKADRNTAARSGLEGARPRPADTTAGPVDVAVAWLQSQCQALEGCLRGVVMIGKSSRGPFRPVAHWSAGGGSSTAAATPALRNAATVAIRKRETISVSLGLPAAEIHAAGDIVACPVLQGDRVLGVVALEFRARDEAQRQSAARTLESNAAALALMLRPRDAEPDQEARRILEIVAASVEHDAFDAAARSATSRFAAIGRYEQATIGFKRRGRSTVLAASGRATVDPRMRSARNMGLAMDEAIAQDATLTAHANLATAGTDGAICTIPVNYGGVLVGAVQLQHEDVEHFDEPTVVVCETTVALIGPILYEKYLRARGPIETLPDACAAVVRRFLGAGNRWRGIVAAIAITLLATPFFASGHYRVTANASLEGAIQRVVAAPVDGFIAAAPARAGDIVTAGQLLARLDDRDLELERLKWSSERNQLQREYREAMAEHDSTRVTILKARLDRANAQLDLTEERLARTKISAPMAGVLVAGDLSQALGAPVEKGQSLFEIAPLDAYRVMLAVDERDVAHVQTGQSGTLTLVGSPDRHLTFRVERVTPIATQADGRNFFTIEARLDESPALLRPGMGGIGKIDIGDRRLAWIWTHRLVDWLRLRAWSWWG